MEKTITLGLSTEAILAEVRALAAIHNMVTVEKSRKIDLFAVLNEDFKMTMGQLLRDSYTDVANGMGAWIERLDDPGMATGEDEPAVLEVTLRPGTDEDALQGVELLRRSWERSIAFGMMWGLTSVADPAGADQWLQRRQDTVREMNRQLIGRTSRGSKIVMNWA